jgi:hypothetical protein
MEIKLNGFLLIGCRIAAGGQELVALGLQRPPYVVGNKTVFTIRADSMLFRSGFVLSVNARGKKAALACFDGTGSRKGSHHVARAPK